MVLIVVAVRDRAVDAYMRPFFVQSVGAAVRAFQDEVNRRAEDNPLWKHPEDYDLFEIGKFDDEVGALVGQNCRQIAVGKEQVLKSNGTGG